MEALADGFLAFVSMIGLNADLMQRHGLRVLDGVVVTFQIVALSMVLGALIAYPMAMMRMSRNALLSGFAFPYRGMPVWAQWLAELLPPTHYIRLVRGIMLKGWEWHQTLEQGGWLLAMLLVLGTIAVRRYRDTIA